MGHIEASRPLWQSVREMAGEAAGDPRFAPRVDPTRSTRSRIENHPAHADDAGQGHGRDRDRSRRLY